MTWSGNGLLCKHEDHPWDPSKQKLSMEFIVIIPSLERQIQEDHKPSRLGQLQAIRDPRSQKSGWCLCKQTRKLLPPSMHIHASHQEVILPIHAHPCITSGSYPPHPCTSMHHISKLFLPYMHIHVSHQDVIFSIIHIHASHQQVIISVYEHLCITSNTCAHTQMNTHKIRIMYSSIKNSQISSKISLRRCVWGGRGVLCV